MAKVLLLPLFMLSWCLYQLPYSWFLKLGKSFGRFLRFIGFRTRIVRNNIDLVFAKTMNEDERQAFHKKVFENIGISFLEIVRNFSLSKKDILKELRISPKDLEVLENLKQNKEGAVFISAHIGNWELFACGVSARDFPVSVIAKKMSGGISQALVESRRKATALKIIYTGGTLQKMAEDLGEGRFVGFMVDQHMPGKKGIRVNFFGVPAASIRGLSKLAKETKCKIIPMCAVRSEDGYHEIVLLPELPYIHVNDSALSAEARWEKEEWLNTQNYQYAIEKLIMHAPEQWLWIHRRWKAKRDPLDFEFVLP